MEVRIIMMIFMPVSLCCANILHMSNSKLFLSEQSYYFAFTDYDPKVSQAEKSLSNSFLNSRDFQFHTVCNCKWACALCSAVQSKVKTCKAHEQ